MTSPFASMAIGARARISLPLGWSGQGTVSSCTSPLAGAGFHGVFLPPGKGQDRSLHFLGDWSRSRAKLHLVEGDYFGRIELLLCGFDLQACAAWRTVRAIICIWYHSITIILIIPDKVWSQRMSFFGSNYTYESDGHIL